MTPFSPVPRTTIEFHTANTDAAPPPAPTTNLSPKGAERNKENEKKKILMEGKVDQRKTKWIPL